MSKHDMPTAMHPGHRQPEARQESDRAAASQQSSRNTGREARREGKAMTWAAGPGKAAWQITVTAACAGCMGALPGRWPIQSPLSLPSLTL